MQGGTSRYFYGPLLPDLISAVERGVAGGFFLGFFVGGLLEGFREIDLAKWTLYGSGLLSTFAVTLVLSARVWA
jgi:hypothetical protein